jgi:hypothetical protein
VTIASFAISGLLFALMIGISWYGAVTLPSDARIPLHYGLGYYNNFDQAESRRQGRRVAHHPADRARSPHRHPVGRDLAGQKERRGPAGPLVTSWNRPPQTRDTQGPPAAGLPLAK